VKGRFNQTPTFGKKEEESQRQCAKTVQLYSQMQTTVQDIEQFADIRISVLGE
jgi:hypothetical protein